MKTLDPVNDAVRQILDWIDAHPYWGNRLDSVLERQTARIIAEAFQGDETAFDNAIQPLQGQLFGWAFETFATERDPNHAPDNVVDDFLKRRGFRLNPIGQRYLRSLRDSAPCIYEVQEVVQGKYAEIQDWIRGGEIVRVHERSGTQYMNRWDRICARVVSTPEGFGFTGAILPLPERDSQSLIEQAGHQLHDLVQEIGSQGITKEQLAQLQTLALQSSADTFVVLWVSQWSRPQALPQLVNSDGDELASHVRRYELKPQARTKVIARLDAVPDLEGSGTRPRSWVWLQTAGSAEPRDGQLASRQASRSNESRVIAGHLQLHGSTLTVTTNSAVRDARLETWLTPLLADLTALSTLIVESLDDLDLDSLDKPESAADEIPPELKRQIEQQFLDQHYHQWIDLPIPALDNVTPREAARDPKLRDRLVDLLKSIENQTARVEQRGDLNYDFGWLWNELGVKRN